MPKNGWTIAAAVVFACGCCCGSQAESDAPFTVDVFKKGLPHSVVLSVIQGRDGYLWLGTLEGLARFDGVDFTVFDENNTPGLKSRRIVSLFEDSKTNLWVGTENSGVALVSQGKVIDIGVGRMRSACEDTNGAVWFYTDEGQLCRYRDKKVNVSQPDSGGSICRALIADNSGMLWLGTDTNLMELGPVPAEAAALPQSYETNGFGQLRLLLASKRGGHWRLAEYDSPTNGAKDFRVQRWKGNHLESNWPYPTTNSVIVAACEDLEGNLIIGTYGDGVFWFDSEGKWERISSAEGLSHSSALSLAVDREGCLWVGTNGGGLNRVKRKIFGVLGASQGRTVQSVSPDGSGGLWIGYNGYQVDHWTETNTGHFSLFSPYSYVKSVLVDRSQSVWAGAQSPYEPRLFHFRNGSFLPVAGPPTVRTNISVIYQDSKGALWVGSRGGLVRVDGSGWKEFTTKDGLSSRDVRAICQDKQGDIWIGTQGGGVNRLREGKFTAFTKADGLPSQDISSAFVDAGGVLWVGTSSGLARYEGGKWTTFAKREGLLNTSVGYLIEDGQGHLWIGSTAGLLRVKKQALDDFAQGKGTNIFWRSYGEPEGLPADECTSGSQPGPARTRDGKLWFPTERGLAFLNPARLRLNTNPPPVMIESVTIDGQLQNTNTLQPAAPRIVMIPAAKETLDIKFTSLNLTAPEKGRYKYRLKGAESAWREAPWNIRTAHYSKLPPGDYQFEVTACNEDGAWNDRGCVLDVKVLPPFWSTWWFRGLAGAVLIGMITGSVYYASTQRLHRQLENLRQHEALEKERARIARDLHDQLGANLTQVALLGELAESDKGSPSEVEAHARQISQTARETTHALDEIVWTVNPSNDTLDGLINYVCKYAQEYLAVAGLKYRLDVPAQLPSTPISPELRHNVFLASKEAITNVVRHAKATAASVRLRLEPARFALEIEDDGRGLSGLDGKQDRNGLRNMRKRMEDVGGEFSIGPANGGGTRVCLTAPLKPLGQ